MPIWQLCANLLIPNCLRSNLSYSPLAALEPYVNVGIPILAAGKDLYAKGRLDILRRKIQPAFGISFSNGFSTSSRENHMVKKTNHQFVADNVWWPVPRFLPSFCRCYMALASEPERISLFWRVTGSCVDLSFCLPVTF